MQQKHKWNIVIYPVLCLIFVWLTWLFGKDALYTVLTGETVQGQVIAEVRHFEEKCDLVTGITRSFRFEQADGMVVTAKTDEEGIVTEPSQDAERYSEILETLRMNTANEQGRFLLRENDTGLETRVVRVSCSEQALLLQNLSLPLKDIALTDGKISRVTCEDGTIRTAADAGQLETVVESIYIGGTDEEKELKTDVKRFATRTLNGQNIANENEDFILYETNFRYIFRPVYSFETPDGPKAALAAIGARETPRPAHMIGKEVEVGYIPGDEINAILLSNFDGMKELSPFYKINYFIEATFGLWFFPCTSLLLAVVYFGMSIVTVSLGLKPPKTEHASTVDKEALATMS